MNYHDDYLAVSPIVCPPCGYVPELCEIDVEGEGARTINPGFKPSIEEVNTHNLTHIPFRSWCPFCVGFGRVLDPFWAGLPPPTTPQPTQKNERVHYIYKLSKEAFSSCILQTIFM